MVKYLLVIIMKNKIKKYILDNDLLNKNEYVVVAVSGGADSIFLLHILNDLGYKTILAHVNHHKRVESLNEAIQLEKLANDLNIPFELLNYYDNNKANFHDQAHIARYKFFKEIADKYNTKYIATAHHLDDQAETILIKLLNGSNLFGYGGISNKLIDDNYNIVRPLLCVTKDDIYKYLHKYNLMYFEDSSNQENDYLRNRIRHNIIPLLKNEEPSLLSKLQEFSIQAKEAFEYIRNQSINYLNKTKNTIEISSFSTLDNVLKKDIICLLFERYPIRKNNDMILKCLSLLNNPNGTKKLSLKNDYYFIISYDKAEIKKIISTNDYKEILTINNEVIIENKYKFYFSKNLPKINAKYIKLCYNSLELPLLIRNKKDGDFIKMSYGNKKVSRLMIDSKITLEERKTMPLVFDSNNNLLWVVPIAKSDIVVNQKQSSDIYLVCEVINND